MIVRFFARKDLGGGTIEYRQILLKQPQREMMGEFRTIVTRDELLGLYDDVADDQDLMIEVTPE